MMIMNKLKKLFVSMLAVIALVCTMVSFSVFATETVTLVQSDSDTKAVGWNYEWTVSKPTGVLKVGENTQKADVTVVYPDGRTTAEKEIKLDVEGIYTVKYTANIGGEDVSYEEEVVVRQELFHVSSKASSVEYTTYKYLDHATEPDKMSARESMINSEVEGLQISLAAGDTFKFGRVIDVSDLTKLDTLIKVVMAPNVIGTADVGSFDVVLTDAYDPTNYVTVTTGANSIAPLVYVLSSASNGQQPTGWEFNRDVKHVGKNGTPARYSFTGPCANTESTTAGATSASQNDKNYGINTIADNDWSLSLDYATKQLHNTTSAHASATTMLVDLDDPTHFEKIWKGFTTGECFLSIKASGYIANTFNFVITEMYGVKNLKRYEFNDRGDLDINVDMGIYEAETLPTGKVGVEYPIFKASTLNQYFGTLNATYQVLSGKTVVCDNGEKFIPETAGTYKLVYTVTDYFGTTNTWSKNIVVKDAENYEALSFELDGKVEAGVAGQYIDVANTINHVGGGSVFNITKKAMLGEEEIEIKENKFFPEKSGTYTVTVTATDYIGESGSVSYDVVIGDGDKPVFVDSPTIPKYFISGYSYILPEITAYDYTTGEGTAVATDIYYVDGEGIKKAINREIIPIVNANKSDVDIYYVAQKAGLQDGILHKNVEVFDIMDGRLVDFSKIFVSSEMEIAPDSANTNMVFKALSPNAYAEMVNPVGANVVSIRFMPNEGKVNFKSFVITLTDSLNANEQVKLIYIPNDITTSYFRVNDYNGAEYLCNQSFSAGHVFTPELKLAQNGVKFDSSSSTIAGFDTYVNGEEFKGFSSNKVYITMGFEEAIDAEIAVINIAGQRIYTIPTADRIGPAIAFEGEYKGYVLYGSEIRIPNAIVADVIDPNVEGKVTVELPADETGTRKIAASTDGVYLKDADISRDYKVKANAYGSYRVTFSGQDRFGNPLSETYIVNVVDVIAPTISIPADATREGKVGEVITLKPATAIDNVDGAVDVLIFVYSPSSVIYELNAGTPAFKTNQAGTYRVMYVARDAAGNIGIETYKLIVTA